MTARQEIADPKSFCLVGATNAVIRSATARLLLAPSMYEGMAWSACVQVRVHEPTPLRFAMG